MALRPEYALGNSVYNEFLFAAVGEEKTGQPLTVLSALARLGFDPWVEAARLAALPREAAARAFAVSIAMLPEGDWKASDSDAIATRLVTALPKPGEPVPAVRAAPGERSTLMGLPLGLPERYRPALNRLLFWAALAGAGLMLGLALQPDSIFEAPQTTTAPERR